MALTFKKKSKAGRPLGKKTRPDAPSKLAKLAKLSSPVSIVPSGAADPIATTTTKIPDSVLPIRSDSEIFGNAKLPVDAEKKIETSLPETELNQNPGLPPGNEIPKDESGLPPEDKSAPAGNEDDHRGLSIVIWDSIVGLFTSMIGLFWLPRPVGKNSAAGEIPYDEREMVISAFTKYFQSIGMKALSPFQELCFAIGGYSLPRLNATVTWLRFKFMKKAKPAQPQPENDFRMPPKQAQPDQPSQPPAPENNDPSIKPNTGIDEMAKTE